MGKYITLIVVLVSLMTGCQSNDVESEDRNRSGEINSPNTGELTIENESYKKYMQSEEKGIAKDGFKEQLFSSDEQREIEQHIIQMEDVEYVHVEVYEDRLNIAVSVKKGPYEELEDEIYAYITNHFPQREIEIFITQITT